MTEEDVIKRLKYTKSELECMEFFEMVRKNIAMYQATADTIINIQHEEQETFKG